MEDALNQRFNWRLTNVPELDSPVLIILDYSPGDDDTPLSIALDFSGGAKCWISEEQVVEIDNKAPAPNSKYKQFEFEGRRFYPFSVQGLGTSLFEDIETLNSICERLYRHIDWGST